MSALARRQPPQWFWYLAGASTLGFGAYILLAPTKDDWEPLASGFALVSTTPGGSGAMKNQFVQWVRSQLGAKVKWASKGDYAVEGGRRVAVGSPPVYDCSGLVTSGIRAVTGVDLRDSHNAQRLFSETSAVAVASPAPGDLGFYGSPGNIYHVVVSLGNDRFISADGASPNAVKAGLIALAGRNRVAEHPNSYRAGEFVAWHKNTYV